MRVFDGRAQLFEHSIASMLSPHIVLWQCFKMVGPRRKCHSWKRRGAVLGWLPGPDLQFNAAQCKKCIGIESHDSLKGANAEMKSRIAVDVDRGYQS